jgi:hypothetical protein
VNWRIFAAERHFAAMRPPKIHFVLPARLVVILLCTLSCVAQNCSDFTLAAQPSSRSVRLKDPLSFVVTLANKSDKPVTVVSRELPNTWAIYQEAGKDWDALSSGGLFRGSVNRSVPEQSTPSVPDLFPGDEYEHVPPGGVLEGRYDLSEDLWKAVSGLKLRSPIRIRVVLGYKYQASSAEERFGMLQCDLQTAPIDVQVILKDHKKGHRSKSSPST